MDLPEREVMIERAIAKTGFDNVELVSKLVDTIIALDECVTANAIHGVAGMRFFILLDRCNKKWRRYTRIYVLQSII